MKKIILCLTLVLSVAIGFSQTKSNDSYSEKALNEDLEFSKIEAKVLKNGAYYIELTLVNYSKTEKLPIGFGFDNKIFGDDGQGNDLKAGDGIYSSKEELIFKNGPPESLVKDFSIVGANFNQKNMQSKRAGIGCKFVKIPCPTPSNYNSCYACDHWGWPCFELTECEISIGF
jgi:hypothetical protein